jgi:VanZ family protein
LFAVNTVRTACLLLAVCWMGVIWYLSAQPGIDIPMWFPQQDKLMHLFVYGVLGLLVGGSLHHRLSHPRRFLWTGLLCGCYGIIDEFHQSFVPGRNADVLDVCADLAGALLGTWLLLQLLRRIPLQTV